MYVSKLSGNRILCLYPVIRVCVHARICICPCKHSKKYTYTKTLIYTHTHTRTHKRVLPHLLQVDMYALGIVLFELLHPFTTRMERLHVLQSLRSTLRSAAAGTVHLVIGVSRGSSSQTPSQNGTEASVSPRKSSESNSDGSSCDSLDESASLASSASTLQMAYGQLDKELGFGSLVELSQKFPEEAKLIVRFVMCTCGIIYYICLYMYVWNCPKSFRGESS
jgi:hypothetical protein